MRTEPTERAAHRGDEAYEKKRLEKITRMVAIIVAFISTFIFFFKILFF
jgi:hypothetical protein